MRINEIASADEQIGLWRLITNSVWSSLDQQAREQAEQKALQKQFSSKHIRGKRGSTGSRVKPPPPLPALTGDKNPQPNKPADDNTANNKQVPNPQPQQAQQRTHGQQRVQPAPNAAQQALQPIKPMPAMTALKPPVATVNKQLSLPVASQVPKPQWAGVKQK